MPLKLYLVRHGETSYNVESRYQGQHDSPLTPRGRQQAQRLGERLAQVRLDAACSSDLRRACETGELALAGRSLPCTFSPLWREVSYGRWEGLTYNRVKERWPAELAARLRRPATVAPTGGENMLQLRDRVLQGLERIRGEHPSGAVLVVSHGGPLRTLLCHLLGIDLDRYWQLRMDLCGLTVVDIYDAGAILALFNDTAHLDGLLTSEANVFLRRRPRRPGRPAERAKAKP